MLRGSLDVRRLVSCSLVVALLAAGVLPGLNPELAFGQEPLSAAPTLRQGLQAYQEGRYESAIPLLREAVTANPGRPRAHAALSLSLLQTGQVEQARQAVVEGRHKTGPHPYLRLARAEAWMRQEAPGEALSIYQELRAKVSSPEASGMGLTPELLRRRMGRAHQQLGTQAFAAGDTARAQRHFETALDQAPRAVGTYANLGVLHLQQGRPKRARALAEQGLQYLADTTGAAKQGTDNPSAEAQATLTDRLLRLKASVLQATGDAKSLAAVYERLAERRPQDVTVQIGYAQSLIRAGSRREGLRQFRGLLDRFPTERRVYDALIDLYDRYRNTEAALQVLRRMQRQFPEDPAVLRRIAERLVDLRRLDDARAAYDSVLTRTGDTLAVARAQARIFEAQDTLTAAADQYRRALRQRPMSDALHRDLGRVLEQSGRWAEALAVYRRWAAQTDGPPPHHRQGRVLERLGRSDSATAAYREALDRGSDHPLPVARLADLHLRQGRSDDAFKWAVEALRFGFGGDGSRKRPPTGPEPSSHTGSAADSARASTAGTLARGVPTAQQRRRQRSARRRRQSVDDAFRLLTQHYPGTRLKPVFDDLLDKHPNSGHLHLLLGTYYEDEGALAAARRSLQRAATLTPHRPTVHRAMGRVATAQGDTSTAIQAYRRALSADAEASEVRRTLIDLHQKQGRLDALIRRWRHRYDTRPTEALRQSLIEALHKSGRFQEARKISQDTLTSNS